MGLFLFLFASREKKPEEKKEKKPNRKRRKSIRGKRKERKGSTRRSPSSDYQNYYNRRSHNIYTSVQGPYRNGRRDGKKNTGPKEKRVRREIKSLWEPLDRLYFSAVAAG